MPTLPPWLDVRPADFTQASQAGASLGEQSRQITQQGQLERGRQSIQAAEAARQAALEAERIAVQDAQAKARQDLEVQIAAKKFQAMQGYQQAVKSGMDPIQAILQFGPQMRESMTGLGQLETAKMHEQMLQQAPQSIIGPNGQPVGVDIGGQVRMFPRATVPQAFNTTTEKFDAVKPVAPQAAFTPNLWQKYIEGEEATPAVPGTPGSPARTVTTKTPIPEVESLQTDEGGPMEADIDYLKAHPDMKANFEKKFGEDSADEYLQ
jgi:hypothetical protein